MINIQYLSHRIKGAIEDNAAAVLTAGGVVGTVATAVLASRASFKAARIIDEETYTRVAQAESGEIPEADNHKPTTAEQIKLVWPQFIPPAVTGTGTITAIVFANRINAQRAAALAAAYGIAERNLSEYRAKVEEKLTGNKAQNIQDEIQQDRIDRNPPNQRTVIIGTGPVLCYDGFSDRYFQASADQIKKAERVVRDMVENSNEASLRDYYDELELPHTQFDTLLGWNIEHMPKIQISPMMVNDSDACLCVDFVNLPKPEYGIKY